MDWRGRIHSDTEILSGKPVVVGTRLSVEFLLRLFAAGWTEGQVLRNYPNLKPEDLRAIAVYLQSLDGADYAGPAVGAEQGRAGKPLYEEHCSDGM